MKSLEEAIISGSMFLMFIILYPMLQGYMIVLDTSAWSFYGASGVIAFIHATPFIFLIAGICMLVFAIGGRLKQ